MSIRQPLWCSTELGLIITALEAVQGSDQRTTILKEQPDLETCDWRVSLQLSVQSRCRISQPLSWTRERFTIELNHNDDLVLNSVLLTSPTEFKFVPTFNGSHIEEPFCPNCDELIRIAQRFEGMFSAVGLVEVKHDCPSWKWEYFEKVQEVWTQHFVYGSSFEDCAITSQPMQPSLVQRLSDLSLDENCDFEALSLTLCREGNNHFRQGRFIDSIRSFYHAVEHHCGDSKVGKKQTIAAFAKSDFLQEAFAEADSLITFAVRSGDLSEQKARELYFEKNYENFVDWLYHVRGEISHQKARRKKLEKWWPSNQIRFKAEATVVHAVGMSLMQAITVQHFNPS